MTIEEAASMNDPAAKNAAGHVRLSARDLDLLHSMYRDASREDIEILARQAERTGLDPFQRQIYSIRNKGGRTIQVGIDGFRLIASRTREYEGQEGPFWCGVDGTWRDVWTSDEPPVAAKVGVWRRGFKGPLWGVAAFRSYVGNTDTWRRMPDVMIAKVAEAIGLRRAFPHELSGLYTADEMDQAVRDEATTPRPAPSPVLPSTTTTAPPLYSPAATTTADTPPKASADTIKMLSVTMERAGIGAGEDTAAARTAVRLAWISDRAAKKVSSVRDLSSLDESAIEALIGAARKIAIDRADAASSPRAEPAESEGAK